METNQKSKGTEHFAKASAKNVFISTKHGIEISNALRYKTVSYALKYLEEVIALKRAVPFKRHCRNVGHKPGMAAGRFPQKAAKEFFKIIKSVEANAQFKSLNTSELKIVKILVNKAAEPMTGGRHRRGTKRSHIEIEVRESGKVSKANKTDKVREANKESKEKKETKESKADQETKETKVTKGHKEIVADKNVNHKKSGKENVLNTEIDTNAGDKSKTMKKNASAEKEEKVNEGK